MPIGTAAAAVIGSTVLSTGLGILQGNKAAKAQNEAIDDATALRAEIYEDIRARLGPAEAAGNNALAAMLFDLGLSTERVNLTPDIQRQDPVAVRNFRVGERTFTTRREAQEYFDNYMAQNAAGGGSGFGGDMLKSLGGAYGPPPVRGFTAGYNVGNRFFETREEAERAADRRFYEAGGRYYEGYTETPGYEFRLKEGTDAIQASAAARGGLYSGATMKSLNRFGQDYATEEYANHLARLFGIANLGTSAISGVNSAGQTFATGAANDRIAQGQNRADALLNVGDQVNSGLQNGLRAFGAFA